MTFQEPSYQPNEMAAPNLITGLFGSSTVESYISSYISYFLPCLIPAAIESANSVDVVSSFPNEKKTGMLHVEQVEGHNDVVQHPYSSPTMAMRHYQRGALQQMTTEQLIKLQHESVDDH